jgi:hypothetical protein
VFAANAWISASLTALLGGIAVTTASGRLIATHASALDHSSAASTRARVEVSEIAMSSVSRTAPP